MIDMHVHTHHSFDSSITMEDYCKKAVKDDIKYICFTDHIDFNEFDYGYGYYDINRYFDEINRVRDKYAHRLNILSGIEFAEPHIYKKQFDRFRKLPYDFILASVHYWLDNLLPEDMIKQGYSYEYIFERYWEQEYILASYGGFDSLAHIDFPKRYFNKCLWKEAQIMDILNELIKKDIALEINTSTLRRGMNQSMPDKDFLNIYEKLGGRKITIGADTHQLEDLASNYHHAVSLLNNNLKNTVFIKRKAEEIRL